LSFSLTSWLETNGSMIRTSIALDQLRLDLLVDGLGDAGAVLGLGGDDAALIAAAIDIEAPVDVIGRDVEPLGRRVDAALRFLGRILEVVEPDVERPSWTSTL
jgi:hypothetical protein